MRIRTLSLPLLVLALAAGCSRDAATDAGLPRDLRSAANDAIREKIETGGIIDIVVDTKGDADYLAGLIAGFVDGMRETNPMLAEIPFDAKALSQALGLSAIEGLGLSSRKLDDLRYRNHAFIYTPEGRTGFLRISGGAPAPFRILQMAPDTVDFAYEFDMNLKSLHEVIGNAAEAGGGPLGRGGWTAIALTPIPGTPVTTLDILNQLETRAFVTVDLHESETIRVREGGASFSFPRIDFIIRIESLAPILEKLASRIEGNPELQFVRGENGFTVTAPIPFPPEIEGLEYLQPVLRVDTAANTVALASNAAVLDAFGSPDKPLGSSSSFKKAAIGLPTEGNGLSYLSPEFGKAIVALIEQMPTTRGDPTNKLIADFYRKFLPSEGDGLVSVSVNLPDGIHVIENNYATHKPTIVALSVYNPVTLGLVAAMAVPAFQQVQTRSQEMTVMNNLRQVAIAGQQLMLDEGKTSVTYPELITSNPPYLNPIIPVAGETYDYLEVYDSGGTLSVTLSNGTPVEYQY